MYVHANPMGVWWCVCVSVYSVFKFFFDFCCFVFEWIHFLRNGKSEHFEKLLIHFAFRCLSAVSLLLLYEMALYVNYTNAKPMDFWFFFFVCFVSSFEIQMFYQRLSDYFIRKKKKKNNASFLIWLYRSLYWWINYNQDFVFSNESLSLSLSSVLWIDLRRE